MELQGRLVLAACRALGQEPVGRGGAGVRAQAGPCGVGGGTGRFPTGASDFPPAISPSRGVSGVPAPRGPLAPGSGPAAPAAFHVLISPLGAAAWFPAPHPEFIPGRRSGEGEAWPGRPAGFICNLTLAPGTGVRALPRETGGHLAGLPERGLGGGDLGRVEGQTGVRGVGPALSLLLEGGGASSGPGWPVPVPCGFGLIIPLLEASVFSPVKWGAARSPVAPRLGSAPGGSLPCGAAGTWGSPGTA